MNYITKSVLGELNIWQSICSKSNEHNLSCTGHNEHCDLYRYFHHFCVLLYAQRSLNTKSKN